jgi:hypothetical protein
VGLCAEHLRGATAYLSLTAHLHFIPNLNPEVKKIYVPEHRKPQISTTMNVYGNALMEAKRDANTKVVRKALRSA